MWARNLLFTAHTVYSYGLCTRDEQRAMEKSSQPPGGAIWTRKNLEDNLGFQSQGGSAGSCLVASDAPNCCLVEEVDHPSHLGWESQFPLRSLCTTESIPLCLAGGISSTQSLTVCTSDGMARDWPCAFNRAHGFFPLGKESHPQTCFFHSHFTGGNGSSVQPGAPTKNLEVIVDPSLSLTPHF